MPRKVQRSAWPVLIAALLGVASAGRARGDHGLEAEFKTSVRAGEPATLVITLDTERCCPVPDCGLFYGSGAGTVDWGEGGGFGWVWWEWGNGPKPQPLSSSKLAAGDGLPSVAVVREIAHTYERAGRYRVGVRYEYRHPTNPPCQVISGVVFDRLTVDVLPNPDFTPDGWIGTFFDPEATVCSRPVTAGTAVYVVARLSGRTAAAIVGAEFRLLRTDRDTPQFLFTQEAMPGWTARRNALSDYGVQLSRPGCSAAGEGVIVPLLKLTATPLVENAYTNLFVTSPIHLPDAILWLCQSGSHGVVAGKGYTALISTFGQELRCDTITSVEQRTWSQIKELYR